jgi:hypothetical protein
LRRFIEAGLVDPWLSAWFFYRLDWCSRVNAGAARDLADRLIEGVLPRSKTACRSDCLGILAFVRPPQ